MNHGSLFSGIGGFDLAAEWIGWANVFHCELQEFPRKVLKHHFPKSISYADIKQTNFTIHKGQIDIITGGFPCQPYSTAGRRLGKEDNRHLWPEMLRAIREIQPRWVVGENVYGLINWNGGLVFEEVQTDLENEGYEVQPFILPAASVNAPHRRDRVWFIAYTNNCNDGRNSRENERASASERIQQRNTVRQSFEPNKVWRSVAKNTDSNGCTRGKRQTKPNEWRQRNTCTRDNESVSANNAKTWDKFRPNWQKFPTQSALLRGDDGISCDLDSITFHKWRRESLKAYGNAIVPQVAYQIFKAIQQYENEN